MAITFRDEKGAPLTHEELDANFRSFFFTASFGENNLTLIRKDGVSVNVPVGGQAFADFQANGGSIGDVYIANSQITGSRMIVDLENGQFYDKTKAPLSDGGGLKSDEWYIDFAPSDGVDYFVHFGSSFAISSSGYLHASGARLEGDITASSGLIGGFNVNTDAITGPSYLGTPSFYISGSAGANDHFISASNFNIKGSGDITGSAVLFSGGTIAGWEITNSQIRKSSNIVLDATNESISIKNSTFGNQGIQLEYNSGTPRFYVGNGATSFVKFDGTDVTVSTRLLEISASNIEISSTEASMSLGNGNIELLGEEGKIVAGTTNKVRIEGNATDAFLVAGTKTGFATNDAGIIIGMDATVPTLDLTKDASNYVRFDTSNGVDIKTDTFKLDTTYFDIDSSTQRLNIFNTASAEIIRLGEISDDASDLYGIKIYDGTGTGSADTIAMFGQQGNKIGGWEVTDSQIRSIPNSGFGGTYAEGETGLIIHSDGRLESSNFVTNVKGWRIDTLGNGSAEFENMRIRGTLKTTVFEKESVNVVGGQLMVANATTIQPLRSEAGTIIAGSSSYADTAVTFSVANVSGFTEGEILKAKSVDDTGFSVEYLYVSGSSRYSQHSNLSYNTGSIDPDGLAGEIYVERAFGGVVAVSSSLTTLAADISTTTETVITLSSTASLAVQNVLKIDNERFKVIGFGSNNTVNVIRNYGDTTGDSHVSGDTVFLIDTDKEFLAGLVSSAKPYNEGQVLVSTGVYNPSQNISSGYIMMNANPRDVSTPYMDIVERTGSGVYDLELRSRLGDLSGLSSAYLYGDNEPGFGLYTENGFFKGSITADTGSIAGILHVATVAGGIETGQKISIGRDVSGTNDGIFVNNNNYWYTDGGWKVGGQTNFISLDNYTDGNLVIRTETFTLDTPSLIVSSSLNSGTIAAGSNADSMTSTSGTGVYIDGTGKFRAGTGTSGDNYIYWDGSTLNIKGSVDITGGTGVTQDQLNTATGSAISSSNAFTNESTASLSGSVAAVTDGLDDKIFTDSTGRAVKAPTASTAGLYLASTNLGFYESGEWKTYMDNQGDFFLTGSNGDKLAWDSSTGILEIKGAINITGNGNAATKAFVDSATGSLSSSLASDISSSDAAFSSSISTTNTTFASQLDAVDTLASGKTSIFKQANAPSTSGRTNGDMWIDSNDQNKVYIFDSGNSQWVTTPDGTYDQTDLINATSSSLSGSIALDLFTDSTGKIVRPPNASATGLYLGDSNLGYYDSGQWKTYMANNGNFFLTGSASNYLYWDGTSLNIAGSINITSGNAATTSSVDTAASNAVLSGSAAAATAEANAQTYTNQATSSLSGSIVTSLDNVSGSLASDISASSATTTEISASQATVNQGLQGVIDGKNAIFRQANAPTATATGDIWIETDQNNRVRVWNGTSWAVSSDSTYDQAGLITNTSASLAADTFTDSTGKIQKTPSTSAAGLYLGDTNLGYYNGSAWVTYMANNGNFFLTGSATNYLAWNGTSLTISGNINVLGGNAATQLDVNTATGSLSGSLAGEIAQDINEVSASTALAQQTATLASSEAALAEQTALTASLNALNAVTRSVDASGKITFPATPSGDGLFIGADKLGFYGSSAWKTYMSSSGDFFLVGDGNNGLTWDGSDLSVDGTIVARSGSIGGIELAAAKMYIGTGTYNNSNTEFYVDNAGNFSLGDKLVWNGSTLAISGNVVITGGATADAIQAAQSTADEATGSAATVQSNLNTATGSLEGSIDGVQTNLNTATGSLEGSIDGVQTNLNTATGSLETFATNVANEASSSLTGSITTAQSTANTANTAAGNAQTTANAATASAAAVQTQLNNTIATTSSLANPTSYAFGAGSGAFDLATATAAAGLNLTSQYLGYHDGSNFKSYMDSSGNFYLTGDGDDALTWDGSNLRIGNRGVGPTITYQFSGSLDANIFDFSISNTTTYTSPVLGVLLQNNNDNWDEGFHTKAVFDRNDGPTFEWDIVVGHQTPATMIGLFKENPTSYSYSQQRHTVYFQSTNISIRENGTSLTTLASSDWTSDFDFSENQQYRVKITLLVTGARYEIYKNGDFTSPAYTYQSAANGVTSRYVRPGASIYYDTSTSSHGLIFRGLAAGAQLGAATKISGNTIQTGKILSSNHAGTSDGSAMSTTGMAIDLDNGAISAKNFRIASDGSAVFSGTMQIGGTDLTTSNTLNSNTTATDVGLENVDNTSDATVLSSAATAANSADKTGGSVGGWTIHSDKIFTGTDENVAGYTSAAGRLIISSSGAIHAKEFYIDKSGNAAFKGAITGGTLDIGGSDATSFHVDSGGNIWSGNAAYANAPFRVSSGGVIRAQSGTVGGINLASDKMYIGAGSFQSSDTSFFVNDANQFSLGEVFYFEDGSLTIEGDATFAGTVQVGGTSLTAANTLNANNPTNILFSFTGSDGINVNTNEAGADTYTFTSDKAGTARVSITGVDFEATGTYPGPYAGIQASFNGVAFETKLSGEDNATVTYHEFVDVNIGTNTLAIWSSNGDGGTTKRIDVLYTGTETQTSGSVGGWTIAADAIYSGTTKDTSGFAAAGGITLASAGSIHAKDFYIDTSGNAFFKGLVTGSELRGTVVSGSTVEGGTVAGATIVGSQIFVPNSATSSFSVDADGIMSASGAHMVGTMTATDGKIGDWIIDSDTLSLRDSNTEIELFPGDDLAGPEIRMYTGSEKKLVISPETELTDVGSANTSTVSLNTTVPSFTVSSNSSNTSFNYADYYLTLSTNTFTPNAAGGYLVNVNQVFSMPELPGTPLPDASVSYPNYTGTNNQWHGYSFISRKGHTINWYLQAVKASDNSTVLGECQVGYGYAYGGIDGWSYYVYDDGSGGIGGQQSVTGDTLITLSNGTTKLAKDILQTDKILAWDWINNSGFVESEINQLIASHDADIYEVETQSGKIIKVSDSHGFWLDNNSQVKVLELQENISQIYLVENDVIVSDTVVRVEKLETTEDVFTFSIPEYQNYISNGILSHNPSGGWTQEFVAAQDPYSGSLAYEVNKQHSINISEATPVKFRYKMRVGAKSGTFVSTNSSGVQTTSYRTTTFNNLHTGHSPNPQYLDGSITIEQPSNFVEIKAGGVQVVSSDSKFVKMSRLSNVGTDSDVLFQAKGGTMETHHIKPPNFNADDARLGTSSAKWDALYVDYINSNSDTTVKYKPLTYLREGNHYMNYSSWPTDSIHTVTFTSIGTSSYKVLGTLRGTSSSYNGQNDMFVTVFNKTSTSFQIAVREISGTSGTMYFDYVLAEGV